MHSKKHALKITLPDLISQLLIYHYYKYNCLLLYVKFKNLTLV
jgi:hypothetical protein